VFPVDNFVHHRFAFAFDLPLINFALGFNQRSGHIVPADVERMRRRNMQGDVPLRSAEILVLATKSVSQFTSTSTPTFPCKNVDATIPSFVTARRFLARARDAFCSQDHFRLAQVAVRLGQRAFANPSSPRLFGREVP